MKSSYILNGTKYQVSKRFNLVYSMVNCMVHKKHKVKIYELEDQNSTQNLNAN